MYLWSLPPCCPHAGIWKRAVLTTRAAMDASVVAQRPNALLGAAPDEPGQEHRLPPPHLDSDGTDGDPGQTEGTGRWRGPLRSEDPAPLAEAWGGRYYYLKHAPFVYRLAVACWLSGPGVADPSWK